MTYLLLGIFAIALGGLVMPIEQLPPTTINSARTLLGGILLVVSGALITVAIVVPQ